MRLDEPVWWYRPGKAPAIARALRPVSILYGWAVARRFRRAEPYRSSLPVICIGNLTAGGTGKTPLAMHIGQILLDMGELPVFLTRGYGGRITGPHRVDRSDTAREVGDEALLLANVAPTVVSRDRAVGARAIEDAASASVIVMDDGLQNPSLHKDLTIALVDARRGIGNGEVLPAGPLRAPLQLQLGLVDAIFLNRRPGHDDDTRLDWLTAEFAGPILTAAPEPKDDVAWIRGARIVAFAGIGHPERFFSLLEELGGEVVATVPLPDHHAFTAKDAERILDLADLLEAIVITTEKDYVRLGDASGPLAKLKARSRTLGIRLVPDRISTAKLNDLLRFVLRTPVHDS